MRSAQTAKETKMKIERFECCPCDIQGMTLKQVQKHHESPVHEVGLALEEIRRIKAVELREDQGPRLETVNAETYLERALAKLVA